MREEGRIEGRIGEEEIIVGRRGEEIGEEGEG